MTTTTPDQIDGRSPKRLDRRRPLRGVLLGAGGMLLLILASRTVTGGFSMLATVTESSCHEGFCVERWHRPDLLLIPGRREVRVVVRDAHGHTQPRMLAVADPFSEYSDVKISWTDGGVALTADAVELGWNAAALNSLND